MKGKSKKSPKACVSSGRRTSAEKTTRYRHRRGEREKREEKEEGEEERKEKGEKGEGGNPDSVACLWGVPLFTVGREVPVEAAVT